MHDKRDTTRWQPKFHNPAGAAGPGAQGRHPHPVATSFTAQLAPRPTGVQHTRGVPLRGGARGEIF